MLSTDIEREKSWTAISSCRIRIWYFFARSGQSQAGSATLLWNIWNWNHDIIIKKSNVRIRIYIDLMLPREPYPAPTLKVIRAKGNRSGSATLYFPKLFLFFFLSSFLLKIFVFVVVSYFHRIKQSAFLWRA